MGMQCQVAKVLLMPFMKEPRVCNIKGSQDMGRHVSTGECLSQPWRNLLQGLHIFEHLKVRRICRSQGLCACVCVSQGVYRDRGASRPVPHVRNRSPPEGLLQDAGLEVLGDVRRCGRRLTLDTTKHRRIGWTGIIQRITLRPRMRNVYVAEEY
jgi:hypothetical protein